MADPFLSAEALRELTDEREHEGQVRVLRERRIPFGVSPRGRLLVTVGSVERWMEGRRRPATPNLQAVRQ